MAISGLHARIASSMSNLLTETKLAIGNGGLGPAWHALHVKNCPLPEIITKEPHLGKYFLKKPQMGKFAHIVHKHRPQRASHFKVFKVLIKRTLIGTINQTPPSLHHIIPCILLSNWGFALCLDILVNVELTQQVRSIQEYNFYCIHQRQIPVSDNTLLKKRLSTLPY